nr:uncharacterized protein LOC119169879 [Rhipicephalus microplus]
MTSLKLPVFDDTRDKWKPYLVRAEAYFEANAITDSKRQRALLVAALSTQTVQVLAGLIAPRTPNSLTYAEAVAAINDYYDPKRHEIAESNKFFTRCQQEGESPIDPMLNRLLGEFEDVFSTDLGLIKGPPASLKLKEIATPKFYHQPLLGLLKPDRQTPPMAATRIQRWALFLGGYQYKLQYSPGADDWTISPGSSVYVRNYSAGKRWTPGRVKAALGARMIAVDTPRGLVRRHIDQVRRRRESTPEPATTGTVGVSFPHQLLRNLQSLRTNTRLRWSRISQR